MGPPRGPPASVPLTVQSPPSDQRSRKAAMAFREVRVFEVREVLRLWLRGEGFRSVGAAGGGGPQDGPPLRGRRGRGCGLVRDGGEEQLTDEFVGVGGARRCARTAATVTVRRGGCWWPTTTRSTAWLETDELTVVKIARAAGPARGGGAGADGAALRAGGVRRRPRSAGHDGAGGRRRAGRRAPGRLRPHGPGLRPGDGPAPGVSRVDLHGRAARGTASCG